MPETRSQKFLSRLKPGQIKVGKMSGWLPAVAVFLCLSMFAIAALVLFQVGADPESPPSAVVTSVSAQGFQGLRRVLEAEGRTTGLNRVEDGPNVVRGDLEIITLDAPNGAFNIAGYEIDPEGEGASSSEAASANETDAQSASDTSASADAASAPAPDTGPGALDDNFYPWPDYARHNLYDQLGRTLLVVAPKWTAAADRKNPRWARGPKIAKDTAIRDMLAELSPMTEIPSQTDKDGKYVAPVVAPGRAFYYNGDKTVIYDKVPYEISHLDKPTKIVLRGAAGGDDLAVGEITGLQSITAPNLVPVITTADGRPVLSRVIVTGGRPQTRVPVYLLSDPDLLNNQVLGDPQKVAAALALIDSVLPPPASPKKAAAAPALQATDLRAPAVHVNIVFNVVTNGMGFDRDLLHALSRPPFIAVPLAMLILGLALMWAAFARFGPAETAPAGPPLGRGVRTLADNAARLMAITLKEARLGPAYAVLMRDIVIRGRGYMQIDPTQSLDDLAERIGKTHGASDSYLALKDRAARVATVHQLIDVTLKLHAWKTEIERAHI